MNRPNRVQSDGGIPSLSSSAMHGSIALSTQWLINKLVTAAATLVVAHFLTPEDYGVARTALSVVALLMLSHWRWATSSLPDHDRSPS